MMYKTSITRWLSLAAVTVLLAACGDRAPSGPAVTETRTVGAFHAVELRGSAKLTIVSGSPTAVTVASTRKRLDNTKTEVVDGMLVIRSEQSGSMWEHNTLTVTINTPTLDAVEINGAGDVDIAALDTPSLQLTMNGAGKVEAKGKAAQLGATIAGAGKMDLTALIADTATVTVDGAGSIDLNVSQNLKATVSGVGKIRYRGNPANVEKTVQGVGSIEAESGK
jgi:Putative auto-transporter adhesin, head GIN domain